MSGIDSAWDEKWSEWIEWSGGDCPIFDNAHHYVTMRDGEVHEDDNPQSWDWGHHGFEGDIIAYRYKLEDSEMTESSGMHPDLEWLATNVSEWKGKTCNMLCATDNNAECYFVGSLGDHFNGNQGFTEPQWLQARKDLGLIMSDEEEEIEVPEYKPDLVNKPPHYQLREGYEVYDLRQDLAAKAANGGATYDQYSDWDRAIEYIVRMWGKNKLEDAKKGRWYLDKLISKLESAE